MEPLLFSYSNQGVHLIRQSNQGESAARNAGVNASKSRYVAFLDADDWWLPNHITILSKLIQSFPDADLLSTSHSVRCEQYTYRASSSLPNNWTGILTDFFSCYARGLSIVNSTTACVKRSALLKVGGFPHGVKRGPDVITWINLALNGSVAHSNVVTAVYNQVAVNRTTPSESKSRLPHCSI